MTVSPPAGAAASAPVYDDARTYEVTLCGVIDVGGMKLRPMHKYRITGDLLKTLPAAHVASAIPVDE